MQTIWKKGAGKPRPSYVTREELPQLVREAIAEIIVGRVPAVAGLAPLDPARASGSTSLPPFAGPKKKYPGGRAYKRKTERAPGHTHRGPCGPKCHSGERGPK